MGTAAVCCACSPHVPQKRTLPFANLTRVRQVFFAILQGLCHSKPYNNKTPTSNYLIGIFINNFSWLQTYSLSLVPTSVGGRGFACRVRRWARDGRLARAAWLQHSSASRAKEKPSQWQHSPASFSAIHSNFYLYVCFFTCRWPASMAQPVVCIPEPSKSSCPGSACRRAGLPTSTWAAAIAAKWAAHSTSFQQQRAGCLHHKLMFKVWLWSEKSQRATAKITSYSFFFFLLNIYPLSIAVHIKFAPFMSCSEISCSPAEPGSWKLLPLCALHGRSKALGSSAEAQSHATLLP